MMTCARITGTGSLGSCSGRFRSRTAVGSGRTFAGPRPRRSNTRARVAERAAKEAALAEVERLGAELAGKKS